MRQKKFILPEDMIPQKWYNIQADMPVKPMPMLNPQTREPVTVETLSELFSQECSRQELNVTDRWIDIPEEVRERYANYRCTPLVRAYGLEEALGSFFMFSTSCAYLLFSLLFLRMNTRDRTKKTPIKL